MLKFPILTPFGIESAAKMTDFLHPVIFSYILHKAIKPGYASAALEPGNVPHRVGVSLRQDGSDKMRIIKEMPFSEDQGAPTSLSHHKLETPQRQSSLRLGRFEGLSP